MKKILKRDWYILLIVAAGFLLGAIFYQRMPARVPIHWDAQGHVNGYGSRFVGAFFSPLLSLGIYLLMLAAPYIDPRGSNYEKFKGSYQLIKCLVMVLLLFIYICASLAAIGVRINIALVASVGISFLFIVLGNVMGRIRFNYFVGIRTPWTLSNEEVWRKTHRFGGPVWVVGGVVSLLVAVLSGGAAIWAIVVITCVIAFIPILYSYLVFRNIHKSS